MRRILGVFAVLIGATILLWIAYNYLVEMQPSAQGRNPLVPCAVGAAMVFVGIKWIRGEQA